MRKRFTTLLPFRVSQGWVVPVLVSLRGNHGELNEIVPWLAFPALSPCEADYVWVLVHILQTSLQMHA